MFTAPTNDFEDPISFMDPYSSLLSPNFTYCGIDGYIPNYYYHDESLSAGESIAQHLAESSNDQPVSASSKMDANRRDGIVEQDNSRNNHSSVKQLISSRRCSKADRHSKIATAQGPRDRRMRLSLDVAIPFFKLLDMLGYDKPSEAIKWLLLQSKPAIEELKKTKLSPARCSNAGAKSAPSTPEGEEVVGSPVYDKIACELLPKVPSSKEKAKHTRKSALKPVAKELRKKARERARERTQKKKEVSMLNVDPAGTCLNYEVVNLHQCHVRPKFNHDIGGDSTSQGQNLRPSSDVLYTIEQQIQDESIPFGTPDDFTATSLVLSANCSQFMSLNYQQEDQTCQFKPVPEFQFQGASWEPYGYQHV